MSDTCGDYGGENNHGEPCGREAGEGTDHKGRGRCTFHEESLKEKHGLKEQKLEHLGASGVPIDSDQAPDVLDFYNISIGTWQNIVDRHPEIREAYKRGKAKASAQVGRSLYEKAENGDIQAQKFYLKCQAGWKPTERTEFTGADGGPVQTEEVGDELNLDEDKVHEAIETLSTAKEEARSGDSEKS